MRLLGGGAGRGIVEICREEMEETKVRMWRACWVEGRRGDIASGVLYRRVESLIGDGR